MGEALSRTLYLVDSPWALSNLRCLTIEYVDCGFEDLYDNWRLSSWPHQITDLEKKFTYSKRTTARMIDRMRRYRKQNVEVAFS